VSTCSVEDEMSVYKGKTVQLVYHNYCISGFMSRCGAGPFWIEQQRCKYYVKSAVRNRCMHYIESLNGHCDSADAQRESRRITEKDSR
jgi:hypothetical protein